MFEFDTNHNDKALLEDFVRKVEQLVSTTIRAGGWSLPDQPAPPFLHLHPEAIEPARAALDEFNQQGHVTKLTNAISAANDDDLKSHGLTGFQLRLKLTVVRIKEGFFRLFPRLRSLRGLIEAIDNLLRSIIEALNANGALQELKDAVFDATEDDE